MSIPTSSFSSLAASSPASMPPPATPDQVPDLAAWRQRIATCQRESVTPEQREASATRRRESERLTKLARRGERMRTASMATRAAFLGSCSSYVAAGAAPSRSRSAAKRKSVPMTTTMAAVTEVFGEAAMPQTSEEARHRSVAAWDAMATLQQASTAISDEEGDVALDRALGQLSTAGFAFAGAGGVGPEAAAEVADASLDVLLDSLKKEPSTSEDCATRFALYERHAETVSTVRASLLRFWEDARDEVTEDAPRSAIDEQLKQIDARTNLELYEEHHRYWFVYSMAKTISRNEASIQAILKSIQARINLLAEEGMDCPICLQPICLQPICLQPSAGGECSGVALGCAHKLHTDCWRHWSAHCISAHKAPFCPTCRNEEFLDEIL